MPVSLSKTKICSFVGDVLPLYLTDGNTDLSCADILWHVEGAAATLRSFASDPLSPFTHGVLITLQEAGEARITATYAGQSYTCCVLARPRQTAAPGETLHYYRGDLHTHTATTHTPAKFAAQPHIQAACIQTLSNDERLDFGILSDHASVMRRRGFFEEFVELENADPKDTVIFPGSESEVTVLENDRFGLPHKHSGEIVVLGADNSSSTQSWQEFYDDMAQSHSPVAIFAHPFVLGVGQNSLWSFPYEKIRTPELYHLMRGIEMGSGAVGGAMLFEYAYSAALDNGFHVSPVCSSDCHGPHWGFDAMRGKTVILATEKTREAMLDALLTGRFYATESGNVKLRYTVNDQVAPATLKPATQYDFCVELDLFETNDTTRPVVCEVISDYGRTLHTCPVTGDVLHFSLCNATARYFYLRLLDTEGRKTWSMPVWTGREIDPPSAEAAPLTPLDKTGFVAINAQTGEEIPTLLDDDPGTAYESDTPTLSVLIDMGKVREICAVGYWARRFTKDWIKETSVDWKAEIGGRMLDIIKRYVTRYAIYTSVDGREFSPVLEGAIRAFGDEELLRFQTHKARYVRFDALSTVGAQSGIPSLAASPVAIGELSVFEQG